MKLSKITIFIDEQSSFEFMDSIRKSWEVIVSCEDVRQ